MLLIEDLGIKRGVGADSLMISLPRLALHRGEIAAITGASGSGKSTLLEMIGLVLRPERLGTYRLATEQPLDIARLLREDRHGLLADIRAQRLGFVLQTGGLLPFLRVRQNIDLPRRMLGLPRESELVETAIERLGLSHLLRKWPAQLSIGERQRVSFVRAIAHQPALLLADEPTAALDPIQARKLFELILELVQRFQIAALLVTHDWDLVRDCGVRNIVGRPTTDADCAGTVFHESA
ncbi:Lipoprotein-releasing system ATP-binding protein LolD [compost metagenome]|jgi:putative ABC transport system ATP-binding protein|uniref:ABC transporter ATP-binding protein n=1 Tax=Pseudomonas neuropathica TaxID=2730425 RepID=A0ACC7N0H1_9PSED|nr:ATP-binding cassette domain-containing protein [Pseudomonas sp. YuFO20]MEB2514593.1 ATP-binding cassette domain-containing protein [Pseudomonas sp. YuFO20]